MTKRIPEQDWKYLRSIQDELLAGLCGKINREALEILGAEGVGEHQKYLKLYKHIEASDRIIADCFNDWRRSNLDFKLLFLHRHNLLTEEQISRLTDESRDLIKRFSAIGTE